VTTTDLGVLSFVETEDRQWLCIVDERGSSMPIPLTAEREPGPDPYPSVTGGSWLGSFYLFQLPEGFPTAFTVHGADGAELISALTTDDRNLVILEPGQPDTSGPTQRTFEIVTADGVRIPLSTVPPPSSASEVPPPTFPEADDAVAGVIAASLTAGRAAPPNESFTWKPLVDASQATCIGEGIVRSFGVARVRELGLGVVPAPVLSYGSPLDRDELGQVLDVLAACTDSWKSFVFLYITEGTSEMSARSAACVNSQLAADDARAVYIAEQGPHDPSVHDPVIAAFERCLTPEELDRIDWN
jgi:hypothetical protein